MKKRTLLTLGALAAVIVGGAGLTLSKALTTQVHAQVPASIVQPTTVAKQQDVIPQVNDPKQVDGEVPDSQEKNSGKATGQDKPETANDVAD